MNKERRIAAELMNKHICPECDSIADDANVFELSWTDYEDYRPHLFIGPVTKTEKDWEEDCKRALRECGEEYIDQENGWIGANLWIEFALKKLGEYGYKHIHTTRWDFCGGAILGDGYVDGERADEGDDEKDWRKVVGDDLLDKAVEHNKNMGLDRKKEMEEEKEKELENGV